VENWKNVPGWEGAYSISDHGRVRRDARANGTRRDLLKLEDISGYRRVTLCYQGKKRKALVHHLVMEAFVGPRPDGREVNHRDGRPFNNHLDNLEYCTRKENAEHAARMSPHRNVGSHNGSAKLTATDVLAARDAFRSGAQLPELAKRYDVSKDAIHCAIVGKTWKHLPGPVPMPGGPAGTRSAVAKLTDFLVAEMRACHADGVPVRQLSERYGVSTGTVYAAVTGRTWKHVPAPTSAQ